MLLSYGALNCFSFKEWLDIDLTLDNKVDVDISMNNEASTAMCFMGANTSGKTNALKVLELIIDIALHSYEKNNNSLSFLSSNTYFMNNKKSQFYLEFTLDNKYYLYELTIKANKIISEILSRTSNRTSSLQTKIFIRENNNLTKNTLYNYINEKLKLKDTASFISTLHYNNIKEIEGIYNYLSNIITTKDIENSSFYQNVNINNISKTYYNDLDKLTFTNSLIKKLDLGITKIEIKKQRKENNKEEIYYPVFYHKVEGCNDIPFTLEKESKGTIKLFTILLRIKECLDKGSVLLLDDLDTFFHTDLLTYIIKLFIVYDNNPNKAQLIFTSYND